MTLKRKSSGPKVASEPTGFTETENAIMNQLDTQKKVKRTEKPADSGKKVGKMFKKKAKVVEEEVETSDPVVKKRKIAAPEEDIEVDEPTTKPSKKTGESKENVDDLKGFALHVPKVKSATKPKVPKPAAAPQTGANMQETKTEQREKSKNLKEERKKKGNENRYDLSIKAKKIWEELRREDTAKDRALALSADLFGLVKGHTKELVFAHDTARVVECLFGAASQEIRAALFQELKSHTINLAKSQYGHFYLIKVLRNGNREQRDLIISSLSGRVVELMKHKIASKVVELAYNDWANASQRALLSQEFYGPEFKLFKDEGITTLAAALKKYPAKKDSFLKHMSQSIAPIIAKGVFNHSLLHRLTHEYLSNCSVKERSEMIANLREAVAQVLHTRDGARVGMLCIWHGNNKDRKAIIKSFKGLVTKICQEEHGHMVLMSIFDCVDDTKYVSKAILTEIGSNMKDIVFHETGRKVVMYLLAGRNQTYTHPQVLEILKLGDGNEFSKKETADRQRELVEFASPAFLDAITAEPEVWLKDSRHCLLLGPLLKYCVGEGLTAAFQAIASVVGQLLDQDIRNMFSSQNEKVQFWVEQSAVHMVLKKLIQHDKTRQQPPHFSQYLIDNVDEETIKGWLSCNRGAFLLVNMIETDIDSVKSAVNDKLKNLRKYLQKQKNKGADLLDSKLTEFN